MKAPLPTALDDSLLPARKRLAPMLASASFGLFVGLSLIVHAFLALLAELGMISGVPSPYGNPLVALVFLIGVVVYMLIKCWTYVAVLSLRIDQHGVRQRQLFIGHQRMRWDEIESMDKSLGRTVLRGADRQRVVIPALVIKNYGPTIGHIRERAGLVPEDA